jgi:hypothetical protein
MRIINYTINEQIKYKEQCDRSDESLENCEKEIEEIDEYFNMIKKEWPEFDIQYKKKHIDYCIKKSFLEKLKDNVAVDEELISEVISEKKAKNVN